MFEIGWGGITKVEELTDKPQIFDSDLIKEISNQTRKDAVKLLSKAGRLKFTEIQRSLGIEDAPNLNFHMRVMKEH